jgi:predicted enzyme related to lactoylglutathione lyase
VHLRVAIALLGVALAAAAAAAQPAVSPAVAVGSQYDTTHVYVAPEDFDRFVASLLAVFGGTTSKQAVVTVTPTASETLSQLVMTPAGSVSVFGFKTPVPFPFGTERTGYLVTDLDAAVKAARANGAEIVVDPFMDPIGRDAIIRWPGGVTMQLYWHNTAPNYHALQTVPESRVYVSADRADEFVRDFLRFSQGKVVSDNRQAPGIEIGRPGDSYRSILLVSLFGKINVLVTDGHLPYPYGHEMTGYEVADLSHILEKAQSASAKILVPPYSSRGRQAALVEFPGGYIAELHSPSP